MSLTLMLTYPFMQRALIAGTLVSLCAALLGVPLVLKRYSMIGDGLSHVSFGALAIAVALGFTPLYFSIPVVILAAFFLLRLATNPRWNSDAAIAVMSASALAVPAGGSLCGGGKSRAVSALLCCRLAAQALKTAGSAAVPYIRRIFLYNIRKESGRKGLRFSSICAMMRMLEE